MQNMNSVNHLKHDYNMMHAKHTKQDYQAMNVYWSNSRMIGSACEACDAWFSKSSIEVLKYWSMS